MIIKRFAAVALALAVTFAVGLFAVPELASVGPVGFDLHAALFGGGHIDPILAFTPLAVMKTDLDALKLRAAGLIDTIKDDMAPDAVAKIEADHRALTTEIRTLTLQIEQREAEGGDPAPDDQRDQRNSPAETERAASITDIAVRAGVPDLAAAAIRTNVTVDAFRAQVFDQMVAANPVVRGTASAVVGEEAQEKTRSAMIEGLSYSLGAPLPAAGPSDGARQFMSRGLVELAADRIDFRGGRFLNARSIDEILTRAWHVTSDFPAIFEGAVNRTLEGQYALAQPTFKQFANKRNYRDFRQHTAISAGNFPMLQRLAESGEIKAGTFGEGKETSQAFSYGRRIAITRQMLINDDLGAIAQVLSSYGAVVALFEEITFYSLAFNGKLADGKTVFHSDHNNLAAAGAAIGVDSVGLGRTAMGKQKNIEGHQLLANAPRFLLTGPDKSTEAEKLLASITPTKAADVNIFSGKLVPIESAQISGNAWHLIGAPELGSNWTWGYLEGYEAPRVGMNEPFNTQGFEMKVEHDFGCGAVNFRHAYKNPGV